MDHNDQHIVRSFLLCGRGGGSQVSASGCESYNERKSLSMVCDEASYVDDAPERRRCLNAVALQNAVLCAECDVVSDSPHDRCLVCGSRSLFNIARMFGGNLPKDRASLIASDAREMSPYELVLSFPEPHRLCAKVAV